MVVIDLVGTAQQIVSCVAWEHAPGEVGKKFGRRARNWRGKRSRRIFFFRAHWEPARRPCLVLMTESLLYYASLAFSHFFHTCSRGTQTKQSLKPVKSGQVYLQFLSNHNFSNPDSNYWKKKIHATFFVT